MDSKLISNPIKTKTHATLPTSIRRHYNCKNKSFTCKASSQLSMAKESNNFYKILSLESEHVGADAIKRAYRSMALRYHPDVCPDPSKKEECTRLFVELQKAYETLSDPVLREIYDNRMGSEPAFVGVTEKKEGRVMRFSREAWADQLNGLRVHSNRHEARRNMRFN